MKDHPDIFALGDCAEIEDMPLIATAQVARQQGAYLARLFNHTKEREEDGSFKTLESYPPFRFRFLGLMLYTGREKSVFVRTPVSVFAYIPGFALVQRIWFLGMDHLALRLPLFARLVPEQSASSV